jgi:DNA ligase (NAD+)
MRENKDELAAIDGIGDKMAQSIVEFFKNDVNVNIINRLTDYGLNVNEENIAAASNLLKNKIFVLTGTLPTLSREEASQMIEEHGGKVSSSVSKKTSYVLAGEKAGSKLEKARKLEIDILNEDKFRAMLKA